MDLPNGHKLLKFYDKVQFKTAVAGCARKYGTAVCWTYFWWRTLRPATLRSRSNLKKCD